MALRIAEDLAGGVRADAEFDLRSCAARSCGPSRWSTVAWPIRSRSVSDVVSCAMWSLVCTTA